MFIKQKENLPPSPLDNSTPATTASNDNQSFVFDTVMFDAHALSALQSIFNSANSAGAKSACVKFMITLQDEANLQALGYSKEQIDTLKPQEVADIIQAGTKAEQSDCQE
ncbi:MAG: hypothetical protein ACOYL3_04965 [Desulfuromonadaceae bacterium]